MPIPFTAELFQWKFPSVVKVQKSVDAGVLSLHITAETKLIGREPDARIVCLLQMRNAIRQKIAACSLFRAVYQGQPRLLFLPLRSRTTAEL